MRRIAGAILGLLSLSLSSATCLGAQGASVTPPRRVVFVCEHGTVKSVVALEYFNRLARAKGLDLEAVSRGTRPDSALPGPVRAGLKQDGFDLSAFRPSPFTPADLQAAVLIVSFDVDVDSVVTGTRPVSRWDNLPSIVSNYPDGRRAILARVEWLVDSLSRTRKPDNR